jgi:hypothetical protein
VNVYRCTSRKPSDCKTAYHSMFVVMPAPGVSVRWRRIAELAEFIVAGRLW